MPETLKIYTIKGLKYIVQFDFLFLTIRMYIHCTKKMFGCTNNWNRKLYTALMILMLFLLVLMVLHLNWYSNHFKLMERLPDLCHLRRFSKYEDNSFKFQFENFPIIALLASLAST